MRGNHALNSTEWHRHKSDLMQHCEILILNYSSCLRILRFSRLSVSAGFSKISRIILLLKIRVEPQFEPHYMVIHVCIGKTMVHGDALWYTPVPLEVWSCIYSSSDNDKSFSNYFSQLEATVIGKIWFSTIGLVENTRWLAPEPWFKRGLPAVYQLPKVLKTLKSDLTKITLSIYLSSSLSWVSPLVTINSFGKPFLKILKIFQNFPIFRSKKL